MFFIRKLFSLRNLVFSFLFFPLFSFAEIIEETADHVIIREKSGNYGYYDKRTVSGASSSKTVRVLNWAKTNELGTYRATDPRNASVIGQFGEKSTGTVKVNVTKSVSRSEVLKNVLSKAKIGGGYAFKGLNAIGNVYIAYQGYMLVKDWLQGGGYTYDPDLGTFVKIMDVAVVTYTPNSVSPISNETAEKFCKRVTCVKTSPQQNEALKNLDYKTRVFDEACKGYTVRTDEYKDEPIGWGNYSDSCMHKGFYNEAFTGYNLAVLPIESSKQQITQSEFDTIIGPVADSNPSPFVNVTPPDSKSEVPGSKTDSAVVGNGESAQSRPFTNPLTGQVEQSKWDFKDGKVNTTTVPRPDLQSNSPEAPKPDPPPLDQDTGSGSGGSNPPPDMPDLCRDHPNVLACQQLGEPDEKEFDDIKIPSYKDDTSFQFDSFLPSSGVCPSPKNFHVVGKEFSVSYDPLCSIMEQARFIILLGFIVMSAYISFASLKGSQ